MSDFINRLLEENLITEEQLNIVRNERIVIEKPLQELLSTMGFIKEKELLKAKSQFFNMEVVSVGENNIDPCIVKLLPYEVAKRYGVFPVGKEADTLILAMSDPQNILALDDVKLITNMDVRPVLGRKQDIDTWIEKHYQLADTLDDLLTNISKDTKIELVKKDEAGREVVDVEMLKVDSSPVIRLVNYIISEAVRERASDIHIEPRDNFIEVRYRIDGYLKSIMKIPCEVCRRLVARIKVLAELDIAESKKPQDGRIKILFNGRKIDLRISTIPTFYGEKAVLRVLDPKEAKIVLDKMGFQQEELSVFLKAINRPHGMILVTGPTGSGKTSTIYAALNFIKSEAKNIITIEDPIEYLIDGVNQIQVNPAKEVTFANGLRSILRQDPNVILVGEIRDRETADIAFRASLTGHLVFSTLHTNNSVSTITRLLDIGLEPYLISSSIILIVAQRLVRLICPHCKEEYIPEKRLLDKFGFYLDEIGLKTFYRGRGCEKCYFSGFLGRTGIFEMLKIDEKISEFISDKFSEPRMFKEAKKSGLRSLASSGVRKVAAGLTTLEEIEKSADIIERADVLPEPVEVPRLVLEDDERKILAALAKQLSSE